MTVMIDRTLQGVTGSGRRGGGGQPGSWRRGGRPELQECRETDDALVLRVPAHDAPAASAMALLYTRYSATVYSVGLRILHDAGGAEDLVQETFWRLWRVADRYEPGRVRFATWLIRLATNLALDEWRRLARRPRVAVAVPHPAGEDAAGTGEESRNEPCDPSADVVDQVWRAALRCRLVAGLERLPREQREAVRLAYFGDMSHAEIATAQQTPLSTVKTRLALGLRKLARDLTDGSVSLQDSP